MATIALEGVSRIYPNGVTAVRDVSLEIRDREFIVLVGPSGCGKSTTLRVIAGLDQATTGNIVIDGRRVNDVPPKDRDLAMVFQSYALYPHLTAYDNMAFGLKLRRQSSPEIESRVREAARILGISDEQLRRKPAALSGGQRQRVAVGRAIVRHPKAFLFDEPLSNLDARMRVDMRTEISKLHRRLASTMVYVTHDQVEAMTMGDRIVVMNEGVIQQVDEPLTLYDRPANAFVAGFIGSPPMNLFHGTIERRSDGVWFVERGADGRAGFAVSVGPETAAALSDHTERPVTFGARAEDISLVEEPALATPGESVTATVEVVEPTGADTHLYLTTGAHGIVARTRTRQRREPGEMVAVTFDLRKCHFFDGRTGAAVAHG